MLDKKFIEHLDELRIRLIKSLIGLAVGVAISFFAVSIPFKLLLAPYFNYLASTGVKVQSALRSLGPVDTFRTSMSIALLFGFGLALPWIGYQLWKFVAPGLYRHEKKYALIFCSVVPAFFFIGVAFAYWVTVPAAIGFFYRYTTSMGVAPDWTISSYFDFIAVLLACFGVVFELPVAVVVLTLMGIVTPENLSKYRRHAIVIIFIVAAILTPPDIVSQLMLGIPMVLLYEVSILASRLVRFKAKIEMPEKSPA